MKNTKKNTIFVHVKTTYCFHKPTVLKFKKSVNEHCFKDNKYFCDLEHVGRNYFAFVVLISRKIRLISHNSREVIQVFYFTGL